jgi:hypothetical protein
VYLGKYKKQKKKKKPRDFSTCAIHIPPTHLLALSLLRQRSPKVIAAPTMKRRGRGTEESIPGRD